MIYTRSEKMNTSVDYIYNRNAFALTGRKTPSGKGHPGDVSLHAAEAIVLLDLLDGAE